MIKQQTCDYRVKRRNDTKTSLWTFQVYKKQFDRRLKRCGDFKIVVVCKLAKSRFEFHIPYGELMKKGLKKLSPDKRGRYTFEVKKPTQSQGNRNAFEFRWHGRHRGDGVSQLTMQGVDYIK